MQVALGNPERTLHFQSAYRLWRRPACACQVTAHIAPAEPETGRTGDHTQANQPTTWTNSTPLARANHLVAGM